MHKRVLIFSLGFLSVLLTPLIGQEAPAPPPGPPPPGTRPPRRAPQNLKLLKPDELMPTMMFFKTSLGVQCSFCHIEGNFASDDNPHKVMARTMIVMARDINAKFPDGKTHVTCFTCHRGATEPLLAPETPTPNGPPPSPGPEAH